MSLKIYFCGSISAGRDDAPLYNELITSLKTFGTVLTEHVGSIEYNEKNNIVPVDKDLTPQEVHDRDIEWLKLSDIVVAEVTIPSLGVGYEIGRAVAMKKTIICLFRESTGRRLSFMIDGAGIENPNLSVKKYLDVKEAKEFITSYFTKLNANEN